MNFFFDLITIGFRSQQLFLSTKTTIALVIIKKVNKHT